MLTAEIFFVLVGLIMLGLPIAVSMGLTAVIFFVALGETEVLTMVPARMYSSTTSFTLLAIPFFILTGNLMNSGGITHRLFRFAQNLVGHLQGGLGHVVVVSAMIFAGMTGAAVAEAAALGTVELEGMIKRGFDRKFSAAIVASASTIGPVIPPSIPFVIYGSITGTSVGRLFLGGFVPGFLMGLALMITVFLVSRRRNYPKERRATLREFLDSALGALSAILTPVIIIGGMVSGIFTPTEAAVAATVYALILTLFVYQEIGIKDLPKILWETLETSVRVLFIISAAGIFGWLLIHQRVPETVIKGLMALSGNPWMVLLIINIILLILGCFMEGICIMLLTIPVFMPMISKLGIDPVHFGVMMTLNLMVGLLTPPVGMVLYTMSSIAKVPVWDLAHELRWHMVALMAVLFLITFLPGFVTFVPNFVMGSPR
ncbi:MAG: TRAP transporter large permease [Deltaproteobacteria bacterium]|nr:TRAP transporter large permease [Deltaproteobacteria bacterium]